MRTKETVKCDALSCGFSEGFEVDAERRLSRVPKGWGWVLINVSQGLEAPLIGLEFDFCPACACRVLAVVER